MKSLNEFTKNLSERNFPMVFPGHWIAQRWQTYSHAKEMAPAVNPNDGKVLLQASSEKQVLLDALSSAEIGVAKEGYGLLSERIEIVRKMRHAFADFQSVLVDCLCVQAGKPRLEAIEEVDIAIKFFDLTIARSSDLREGILSTYMLEADLEFELEPVGIVVAYLPFSNPIVSFAKYFCAATLAGCPLILCPSMHASLFGVMIGYLAEQTNIEGHRLAVVFGAFSTFQTLISDRRIQAIIYTGSREHCEIIRKESRNNLGRELILQSGGKNSVLVHSTADVSRAVTSIVKGAFRSGGQLCTSTSRVFVHKNLIPEVCEAIRTSINDITIARTDIENDNHQTSMMGPMYSAKAVEKFLRYQTMAHRDAVKDIAWGKAVDTKHGGFFVTPGAHLMRGFDRNSAYQANVLFCPDIAIYEYDVLDQAIEMINATDAPYCLSFIGSREILQSRVNKFLSPNIFHERPTTDAEYGLSIAGKYHAGHHRYGGLGLTLLLTYPKVVQAATS